MDSLLTVVELPHYIRKAEALLSKNEQKAAVDYLAAHPEAGVVLQGTGGLRKLRWAAAFVLSTTITTKTCRSS
jgi:hypothetical protein